MWLDDAAPVNFVRTSAEVLLTSLAAAFDEGTTAVILSGTGPDGTREVRAAGDVVLLQDEACREHSEMPRASPATSPSCSASASSRLAF